MLLLPPLPGHWLFSQGDTSKHQRRRGRPGCQHGANPTLLHPLPQTGACYPRWARSTPRIHTACHLGTLVKICFVSLINNTPFLLQTRGGRECRLESTGTVRYWSLNSDKESCWKLRRCYLLHQYLLEFRQCFIANCGPVMSVFFSPSSLCFYSGGRTPLIETQPEECAP